MEPQELTIHACEQALRFTQVAHWNDLTEERKVQLGFNMGLMAMSLNLSKEDGYIAMSNAREDKISMQTFRNHVLQLVATHGITVNEDRITRPF